MPTWPFSPITTAVVLAAAAALIFFGISWYVRRRLKPFELATDTVQIGEWTWRYHKSGQGPHLLLLHGIGANLYCWQKLIPLLNRGYTVWAIDLPGFGGTSKPKAARYGLDDQVARLTAFMDTMQIPKSYVVGCSMGGNIALWLAREKPGRVISVAVIAPAAHPSLVPLDLGRLAWLSGPASLLMTRTFAGWAHRRTVANRAGIDGTRVEETYRTYKGRPEAVRSFIRATEAIRDPRLPAALANIPSKVLLLWGSADLLVSKKVMDGLKAALRASDSHVHEGGGHHLMEDDPEWCRRHIVGFFSRIPDEEP